MPPLEEILCRGRFRHPGRYGSAPVFSSVCTRTGAASGALADVGITDRFMKELATVLIPSRSALFVLTRRPTSEKDRVLEDLKGLGGKIFTTSLSNEDEARLQAALNATKSADP